MPCSPVSPFLNELRGRINLVDIPFSDAGSRLLLFRDGPRFYIRLAERWHKWETEVGNYRQRVPVLDELELCDSEAGPVDPNPVAYPHVICLDTRLGPCSFFFEDEETLYFRLPPARLRLSFRVYASQGRTDRRGGEFKGDPEHRRTHRNIAYTTNARILTNEIKPDREGFMRVELLLESGPNSALVLNITPRLGFNRRIQDPEQVLSGAERRWHAWFAAVPKVENAYTRQYYYAWWILRAGLLSPRFFLTRPAMMPSMIHYVGVWAWDAYFHALAYAHIDLQLAQNQLRVLLDHQRADGMIPDAVHDEGIVIRLAVPGTNQEADVTKPPLIAWAAWKLYKSQPDRDFLDEIYEPICRWNRWWFEKNDDDRDGIAQYNHPNSSGLDDNPLWDDGMPVESPDLNTYLVLEAEALARMAQVLGLDEEAMRWRAQADALTQRIITHFWDPEAGVFWAQHNHERVQVLTPFNLYPLLTGRLPAAMNERLVAHLLSPAEFWAEHPIPSVARNSPKYEPDQMWRGPTWVNINYLFIEGLQRCGYRELARELADKTLWLLMSHNDIYEYYNPDTGAPPSQAASVFGWSSALFVDLAIKRSRGEI